MEGGPPFRTVSDFLGAAITEKHREFLNSKGYDLREEIGVGRQGSVRMAYSQRRGKHVSIKVIPKKLCVQTELLENELETLERLKLIRHRNALVFFEAFGDEDNHYIVTELMCGGTLEDFLRGGSTLTEDETLLVGRELFSGLNVLHLLGVAHRDVKEENVMFALGITNHSRYNVVKLLDFGTAYVRPRSDAPAIVDDRSDSLGSIWSDGHFQRFGDVEGCPTPNRTSTVTPIASADISFANMPPKIAGTEMNGTPMYIDPARASLGLYSPEQSDVWSVGVVMYRSFCGTFPFAAPSWEEARSLIVSADVSFAGKNWAKAGDLAQFLRAVFQSNEDERPTPAEAIEMLNGIFARRVIKKKELRMNLRVMDADVVEMKGGKEKKKAGERLNISFTVTSRRRSSSSKIAEVITLRKKKSNSISQMEGNSDPSGGGTAFSGTASGPLPTVPLATRAGSFSAVAFSKRITNLRASQGPPAAGTPPPAKNGAINSLTGLFRRKKSSIASSKKS